MIQRVFELKNNDIFQVNPSVIKVLVTFGFTSQSVNFKLSNKLVCSILVHLIIKVLQLN